MQTTVRDPSLVKGWACETASAKQSPDYRPRSARLVLAACGAALRATKDVSDATLVRTSQLGTPNPPLCTHQS
jgi:hypothetical protein